MFLVALVAPNGQGCDVCPDKTQTVYPDDTAGIEVEAELREVDEKSGERLVRH